MEKDKIREEGEIHQNAMLNENEYNALSSLLSHNCEKMHYQENMCFQIRNWAIILTVGSMSLCWSDSIKNTNISLIIHIIVLIILLYYYKMDKSWHRDFIKFRDRMVPIEKTLVEKTPILNSIYYYNRDFTNKSNKKNIEVSNYTIPLLIILNISSLIFEML